MFEVNVRSASTPDLARIRSLLEAAGLPCEEAASSCAPSFCVAELGKEVIGAGAIELSGRLGLLRSVAVSAPHRGLGIGSAMVADRLEWARAHGVSRVFLLTIDAVSFCERNGFRQIPRAAAPAGIRDSPYFTRFCPSTAVLMARSP